MTKDAGTLGPIVVENSDSDVIGRKLQPKAQDTHSLDLNHGTSRAAKTAAVDDHGVSTLCNSGSMLHIATLQKRYHIGGCLGSSVSSSNSNSLVSIGSPLLDFVTVAIVAQ
jgi:hypothetical protein